jgi:dinuclear metal center YbgI/SA1388 family protein
MLLSSLLSTLEELAPLGLAEPWDNVGLLVDGPAEIAHALLCIDYTREVAEEADALGCDFVLAYHPVIFEGLKRLRVASPAVDAVRKGRAIYSPHTALDVAAGGTNDVLADAAGVASRGPLRVLDGERARRWPDPSLGLGRVGDVPPTTRRALVARVKGALGLDQALVAGPLDAPCARVAVSAGAAGDMVKDAARARADVYVTGELRHHDALWAAANGMTVVCLRHSASERAVLARIEGALAASAPELRVSRSACDRDPFEWG